MITSIDHIVLTSKDVDKTIFFYCDILGMKLEENIDELNGGLNQLTSFVIPGGTSSSSSSLNITL